jgi:hypothetical protein
VQGRGDPVRGVRLDVSPELVLDLERVLVGEQPAETGRPELVRA